MTPIYRRPGQNAISVSVLSRPYLTSLRTGSRRSLEMRKRATRHELARAIQIVTYGSGHTLVVVDGKCGPIEHSWLCFSDGVILDPYVPGRMPAVQLIDPIVGAPTSADRRRTPIFEHRRCRASVFRRQPRRAKKSKAKNSTSRIAIDRLIPCRVNAKVRSMSRSLVSTSASVAVPRSAAASSRQPSGPVPGASAPGPTSSPAVAERR